MPGKESKKEGFRNKLKGEEKLESGFLFHMFMVMKSAFYALGKKGINKSLNKKLGKW